ncbi:hypothetical protein FCM30_18380 [Lelliottia aquatilis]|uniref:hypothetical protein n=1 Tax=Lelliottia aquatilis TaxID=2080838 RepID=UPI00157642AB|nr:hypothetical protein [Lelliottia aquatilis]NTZ47709.1 hypothetical protein [Lelliottia aquatilis]
MEKASSITEHLEIIIKKLSLINTPENKEVIDDLRIFTQKPYTSWDLIDCFIFYDAGVDSLKMLNKIKRNLTKTEPDSESLMIITSSIDDLKKIIRENTTHIREKEEKEEQEERHRLKVRNMAFLSCITVLAIIIGHHFLTK